MDNTWIAQLPYLKLEELRDLLDELLPRSGSAIGKAQVLLVQTRIDEYLAAELREEAKQRYLDVVALEIKEKVKAFIAQRENMLPTHRVAELNIILDDLASYGLTKTEAKRILDDFNYYTDSPIDKGEGMAVAPYQKKIKEK